MPDRLMCWGVLTTRFASLRQRSGLSAIIFSVALSGFAGAATVDTAMAGAPEMSVENGVTQNAQAAIHNAPVGRPASGLSRHVRDVPAQVEPIAPRSSARPPASVSPYAPQQFVSISRRARRDRYDNPRGGGYYWRPGYRPRYDAGPHFGCRVVRAGFYGPVVLGPRHYGRRFHGPRHRYRRGLTREEAAVIAAGIFGGVILIDRFLEESRRPVQAYPVSPYYDPNYRSGRSDDWRTLEAEQRRLGVAQRDFDRVSPFNGDDLETDLFGGARGAPYRIAFRDCAMETRAAALDDGVSVTLPSVPTKVTSLGGGAYRMVADFMAENRDGALVRRNMQCDADDRGVLRLEITP